MNDSSLNTIFEVLLRFERLLLYINYGQFLYVQHGRRLDDTDKLGIFCSVRLSDSFLTNSISGTTDRSFCWIFVL